MKLPDKVVVVLRVAEELVSKEVRHEQHLEQFNLQFLCYEKEYSYFHS